MLTQSARALLILIAGNGLWLRAGNIEAPAMDVGAVRNGRCSSQTSRGAMYSGSPWPPAWRSRY
jgi:hypothetical protein